MNEFVPVTANSLILIGLMLRTFSAAVSDRIWPVAEFVHEALPTISPLKAADADVTLNIALTVAPGKTESEKVFEVSLVPETEEVHPEGTEILNEIPVAGTSEVFLNVTMVSCEAPSENVWSPGGVADADIGARLNSGSSYLAATTFA